MVENILTGAVTGLLVGWLGVRFALEQFKAQRAFDRQLEWYERTMRALGALSHLKGQMESTATLGIPDRTLKAYDEYMKGFADLGQCIIEAVLYAEQESYEQLKCMGLKYDKIKNGKDGPRTAQEESAAVNKVLRDTVIELSRPIRKKLGLKKIKLPDLEK